jgi:hypothetical protein
MIGQPRQRGGVRLFGGTRTPLSNAANQRALRPTTKNKRRCASAPLHWLVRQRVLQHAAAPTGRAFKNRAASYALIRGAATHHDEATTSPRGGVRSLGGIRTPMSNAHHHGARERQWPKHEKGAARAPVHGVVRQRAL